MLNKLSDSVWFGDKPSVVESLGRVQAVINVAHSIRKPYWSDLGKLDYRVWYFRLASPDRDVLPLSYLEGLTSVVEVILVGQKLPVLCHCKMGGHRGPSSALFVHWHLSGRTRQSLLDGMMKLEELTRGKYVSKYLKEKDSSGSAGMYRRCIIRYCEENSVA